MAGNRVVLTFIGDDGPLSATMKKVENNSGNLLGKIKGLGIGIAGLGVGGLAAAGGLGIAGVAIAGIGVIAAAQSQKVKDAFTGLKNHVVTQVQKLAAPFTPVLTNIAGEFSRTFDQIAPMLGKAFQAAAPYVQTLANGVSRLVTGLMPGFTAAVQAAGPVIQVISNGVAGLGRGLGEFFNALAGAAGPAAAVLGNVFSAINTILPALGQLVAAAATGLGPVFNALLPVVTKIATTVGGALSQAFLTLGPPLTGLAQQLGPIVDAMLPPLLSAFTNLIPVVQVVVAIVSGLLTVIQALAPVLGPLVIAYAAWTVAQWALNAALDANPLGLVVLAIAALVGAIVWAWNNSQTFRDIVLGVWDAVKTGISTAVNIVKGIIGWFANLPGMIAGWFGAARDWAVSTFTGLVNWIRGLPGRILSALGNLGSLLASAGRDLLTGLWNGISGAAGWLWGKIRNFFGSLIPGWAKSFLGISSPSKVFRDEIGKFIPEGLAIGIEANTGPVISSARAMTDAAMQAASPSAQVWQAQMATGGAASAGATQPTLHFSGNTDTAFATAFMQLVRTGQIQIRV